MTIGAFMADVTIELDLRAGSEIRRESAVIADIIWKRTYCVDKNAVEL